MLAARARAIENETRQQRWMVWHTAALTKSKMPPLEDFIALKRPAIAQSPEEMKAVFAAMRSRAREA